MFSASKTAAPVSGSFQVSNSLRFRSSATAYLNRTPASAGNRQTWTWSGWVKRGTLGAPQVLFDCDGGVTDTTFGIFGFTGSDTFEFLPYEFQWRATTQVFRDPSAWYHLVVAFDTTQAVAANRIKIYLNGTQITAFSVSNNPTQNASYGINQAAVHNIAKLYGGRGYFDGYMAEVNFIDGQALTPSSFGSINATTGVWQPARYTGSYGTNGFYLKFNNGISTTTLGNDSSGNNNNWTTNNISLTAGSTYDWMIDSPTSYAGSSYGVGNYAVMNPLNTGSAITLSNGNLKTLGNSGVDNGNSRSTFAVITGKWYIEITCDALGTATNNPRYGIILSKNAQSPTNGGGSSSVGYDPDSVAYQRSGDIYSAGSSVYTVASYGIGDVIGVAIDADNGAIYFSKNGTWQNSGVPTSGGSKTGAVKTWTGGSKEYVVAVSEYNGSQSSWNFGQRPFAYTPPSGFKSLCTQNLPAPAIYNGANHMAATTYTGTGSSLSISNSVNSASFQPDLVWIKSRSAATDHALYDVIRGTQDRLESNTTDAAVAADNGLTAFGSSGFTVNTLAQVNTSAATYVGWQWKAGGTAVTNTSGSITSQVSANTTAGFSVVTYTGTGANATVGHGLGVAPSFIICKARGSQGTSSDWACYHVALGATNRIWLNLTNATAANIVYWNNTAPTSSVFSLGAEGTVNTNSNTNVAYCFAAIAGYSAFGSYVGNSSQDGTFIYTGFRPRWIMIKNTTSAYNWIIFDSVRLGYNYDATYLIANSSAAEATDPLPGTGSWAIDILSNGFKNRDSSVTLNNTGQTYIYAAFAENPFQNSLAR